MARQSRPTGPAPVKSIAGHLAQKTMDQLRVRASKGHTLRRRAASVTRKCLLRLGDWDVYFDVAGKRLIAPLSHDLGVYQAQTPDYSMGLGRIARHVDRAHNGKGMIDIGANIGDSVAIVRASSAMPVLAVEGDEAFLPYLRSNTAGLADVEVEDRYLGSDDGFLHGQVVREGGTASITTDLDLAGPSLPSVSIEGLLSKHPRFVDAALVKIDTDGHDADLIVMLRPWLTTRLPVVYFEFDAVLSERAGGAPPSRALTTLLELGYERALFFTNTGEFLIALDAAAWADATALEEFGAPGEPVAYFDVCAFGPMDRALADQVEADERDLRRRRRGVS